jgi:sugar phosphate isomerase/epimerase
MIKTSTTIPLQHDTPFSPFFASEFKEGVQWAKDSGFDAVELVISEPEKVGVDVLNALLRKQGLEVSTIATGQSFGLEGISFIDNSKEIREKAVQKICRHIDLSVELLGRPHVTVGLIRGIGDSKGKAGQIRLLKEAMTQCAEYAARKNVVINFEPINRYEAALVNSTAEGAEFLSSIGDPASVGILYDTFHSNIEDKDMLETVRKYVKRISHVHFADSNRGLPGDGHIDFGGIIRQLSENNYQGYVSFETLNLPNRESIKNRAAESIGRLLNNRL